MTVAPVIPSVLQAKCLHRIRIVLVLRVHPTGEKGTNPFFRLDLLWSLWENVFESMWKVINSQKHTSVRSESVKPDRGSITCWWRSKVNAASAGSASCPLVLFYPCRCRSHPATRRVTGSATPVDGVKTERTCCRGIYICISSCYFSTLNVYLILRRKPVYLL